MSEAPPEFNFTPTEDTARPLRTYRRRKRTPLWASPWLWIGGVILGGVVILGVLATGGPDEPTAALTLSTVEPKDATEGRELRFRPGLKLRGVSREALRFAMTDGPPGAAIDPATGEFAWTPSEAQGPGEYTVTLAISGGKAKTAETTFTVTVAEDDLPPAFGSGFASLTPTTARPGERVRVPVTAADPDVPAETGTLRLASGDHAGGQLDADEGVFLWDVPDDLAGGRYSFAFEAAEPDGTRAGRELTILVESSVSDERPRVASLEKPETSATESVEPAAEPEAPPVDPDVETLRALYEEGKLTLSSGFPTLRQVFADRFARAHAADFRAAWGEDFDAMTQWLDERPAVRAELFTAIDPEHDDVREALSLFNEIRKQFPEAIEPYAHLAIATALVWDKPGRAVYDYANHQRRTQSNLVGEMLGPMENFRYIVEAESVMQGRARFLPWEFLVWIVNHKTPVAERQWALQNYLGRLGDIGKSYQDVPYDDVMLDTESKVCRLGGKSYTLPNIRAFGGVCAMQADFASRVAKSLGVPAAYVAGEGRYGDRHAWLMFVNLGSVTPASIRFELESSGRYRGDKYYVGELHDPHTGERITDRQMERRLHTVGINAIAKRHADLAVRALRLIRTDAELTIEDQIKTLLKILDLCPPSEPAWEFVAELATTDRLTDKERRMLGQAVDRMFLTFAGFPDFTWTLFDDLAAIVEDEEQKTGFYVRLAVLYEKAGRPDLACEARLVLADWLVAAERAEQAVQGLAVTILRFPEEGRFVPRLLDRMEVIYRSLDGQQGDLVAFYQQLLPKIPPKRGDSPSKYAMEMYERAVKLFQSAGRPDLAAATAQKLAILKQGG